MSPRHLDFRILCEYGAPIESILGTWPALPLVERFFASRGSKPLPRDIIMVALRHASAHMRRVHVRETQLVPGIVQALDTEDMHPDIFPELTSLSLRGYRSSATVAKALSRIVLYPRSIDSEKRGALLPKNLIHCVLVRVSLFIFLDATVTVRVL
jgi:hypothetical protein